MSPEELLQRVADQALVTTKGTAAEPGPEVEGLLASLPEVGSIPLSDLTEHPDQRMRERQFRHGHIVEPGISAEEVASWQSEHERFLLPRDVREMLSVVNGIHLWADLDLGVSYHGIQPLREWQDAASMFREIYEATDDPLPKATLVISYHDNGDAYVLFDTLSEKYEWYYLDDFDNPTLIGGSVEELLDFWWTESEGLDPREQD